MLDRAFRSNVALGIITVALIGIGIATVAAACMYALGEKEYGNG